MTFRLEDMDTEAMLKCPTCGVISNSLHWKEMFVYCEDCGEHPAAECPECGETVDTIFTGLEELEVEYEEGLD